MSSRKGAARATSRPRAPSEWMLGGILVLLTAAAFAPCLNAGFLWDDDVAVQNNRLLHTSDGLKTLWTSPSLVPQGHYWPMVYTTFWIEYQLWGLAPLGFHLVNVLLHILNVILLWRLLRRAGFVLPWVAAGVFALHPMHVESVAWIVERKDVLSALFYILSATWFVRFYEGRKTLPYVLALGFFVLALLSKSITVSLPLALVLWIWWRRGVVSLWDLRAVAPFAALSTASVIFDLGVHNYVPYDSGLTGIGRFLVAGRAVCFYLGKLAWPADLAAIYPKWSIDPGSPVPYIYPLAVAGGLAALMFLGKRLGRGPAAAGLFFVITLGPVLSLVDFGYLTHSYVADRFVYLASIGPVLLLTGAMDRVFDRLKSAPTIRVGLLTALLAVLGALTWMNSHRFRDQETLFRDSLAKNPGAYAAHGSVGAALLGEEEYEDAAAHFRESLRLNPLNPIANNGLGYILMKQGDLTGAMARFQKALEMNPEYVDAHNNLGAALLETGKPAEALKHLRLSVELNPQDANGHLNLGHALLITGRADEAMNEFETAGRIDPGDSTLPFRIANLLVGEGRFEEAVAYYRRSLALDPEQPEVLLNLGRVLVREGQTGEALGLLRRVVDLDPGNARTRVFLARVLGQTGNPEGAIQQYEALLAREPGFLVAAVDLGWIYAAHPDARTRDGKRAVELAENAALSTRRESAPVLDLLGAAYAEAGRYAEAVAAARESLRLSTAAGDSVLSREISARLELYAAGKPFRTPAPR